VRGSATGCVLACPLARHLLTHGEAPSWWTGEAVLLVEGEPDHLVACVAADRLGDRRPVVVGVSTGASLSAAIAARLAESCSALLIATDPDPGGDQLARRLVDRAHGAGLRAVRLRPRGGDLADLGADEVARRLSALPSYLLTRSDREHAA
jgi:pimeloyl-ACP methyl ester carboxylesterase